MKNGWPWPALTSRNSWSRPDTSIGIQYVYKTNRTIKFPSAVQQSVPAWLVFSMFFIVIPISNTFIAEADTGHAFKTKKYKYIKVLSSFRENCSLFPD